MEIAEIAIEIADIAQNEHKRLIFIVVPLIRLKNIKERWKKNRKIYLKQKNICNG